MNMLTLKATADAAGDGTKATTSSVHGSIKAVYVKYDAASAAGTDVTLTDSFGQAIVTLTNANTTVMLYPRTAAQDNAGADLVYLSTDTAVVSTEFSFYGNLTLTIADQTAAKAVEVFILYESA